MDALESGSCTAVNPFSTPKNILLYVQVVCLHVASAALNGLSPPSLIMDALKAGSFPPINPFPTLKNILLYIQVKSIPMSEVRRQKV